jgi:hypothetical protein
VQTFYALLRKTEPRDEPYDAGLFLILLLMSQLVVPLVGISNFWTVLRGEGDNAGLEEVDEDDEEDDVTPATGGGAASASKGDGDMGAMEDDEKASVPPPTRAQRAVRVASVRRVAGALGAQPSSSQPPPLPRPPSASPDDDPLAFKFANPYFTRVQVSGSRE